MSLVSHSLKERARQGDAKFGLFIMAPGFYHARHAASASSACKWVLIDSEHGLIPLQGPGGAGESIAGVLSSSPDPPVPIVRVPAVGPSTGFMYQIGLALDAGAQGVMVPMVSTKAQAETVAEWCKLPPIGKRGFGNPITQQAWATGPLKTVSDVGQYLEKANDAITVFVQIENPTALENVDEIAQVPGIDVLFIGPSDLSLSLGYMPPNPDPHPEVEKAIQKIVKAAHNAGKLVAMYCPSGKIARRRVEEGFDLVIVQNDWTALGMALAREFEDATAP